MVTNGALREREIQIQWPEPLANSSGGQTNTAVFNNVAFPAGAVSVPAAPAGLTVASGNTEASLSWTNAAGAASYNIQRGTSASGPFTTIATGVNSTTYGTPQASPDYGGIAVSIAPMTYNDYGLSNGTAYYYIVNAVNSAGVSPNSVVVSATTSAAPAAVTGLTVTATTGQITLTWTAVPGATVYNVRPGTQDCFINTLIGSNLANTTTTDTAVNDGTTYIY